MLREDLVLTKKIKYYFKYVLVHGIRIEENDNIEIVISSYLNEYLDILKEILNEYNAKVYITYTDGNILSNMINTDYNNYLNSKIEMYKALIRKGFKRLNIISPFTPLIAKTKNAVKYLNSTYKFEFVRTYFENHPHTTFAIPNSYWSANLGISEEELFYRIFNMTFRESILEGKKEFLDSLNITKLYFKNSLGTNLRVGLTNNFKWNGNKFMANNISYLPNIPCLEIFTSPNKFEVDGTLVSSKPLYYKGHIINNYELTFKDGIVIKNKNLDEILNLEENLKFSGEIALVLGFDEFLYRTILLDENTGCHLALGNSYKNNISEIDKINYATKHIDLVFGTLDLEVYADTKLGHIKLIENGVLKV